MILIGLGANLNGIYGSPEQCLHACPALFTQAGVHIIKSSNIWRSAPVPISDQPWYKNAVCMIETKLAPQELLTTLATLEGNTGRTRSEANAPRVLDLDILAYDEMFIQEDHLQIPHPRMHERAFVLYPLQEILPNWIHPTMNKSIDELIDLMPKGQEIQRIDNSALSYSNDTNKQ